MSGAVAKKIALFEFPVEESSRLKRKHAIKRKKQKDKTHQHQSSRSSNSTGSIAEGELSDRSRSESDLCSSSCGYGTGELSLSSLSRQSSPSIADSDNSPEILLENENSTYSENECKRSDNKSPNSSLLPQIVSNYRHTKSNSINRDSNDYRIRDRSSESSTAIVYSDVEADSSVSIISSVKDMKLKFHHHTQHHDDWNAQEENNYCDDAFPSQSQSVLNLHTLDSPSIEQPEKLSILNSANNNKTTSKSNINVAGQCKKFNFQSVYPFTKNNGRNKRGQALKKTLFFFNNNFVPQTSPTSDDKSVKPNISNGETEMELEMEPKKLFKTKSESNIFINSKFKQQLDAHFQSICNRNNVRQHEIKSSQLTGQMDDSMSTKNAVTSLAQDDKEKEENEEGDDQDEYEEGEEEEEEEEPFYEEVSELRANSNINKFETTSITTKFTEGGEEQEGENEKSAGVKKELSKTMFMQFIDSSLSSKSKDKNTATSIQFKNKGEYDKSNADKLKRNNDTWKIKNTNRCRSMETLVQSLAIRASLKRTTTTTASTASNHLDLAVGGGEELHALKDEDTPSSRLSSCPPPPTQFQYNEESLYSEPIYGQSGSSLKSTTLTNGSLSSSRQQLGPSSPWSPSSPGLLSNENDSNYNASTSSFDQTSSSIYSFGANSSTSPTKGSSNYDINYGNKTLPPPPPNAGSSSKLSSISSELLNSGKFSSIAKTAGRKIAKKLLSIRRTSRTSFDIEPQPYRGPTRRVSSPGQIQCSSSSSSSSSTYSSGTSGGDRGDGSNYNRIYSNNSINGSNNHHNHNYQRSGSLNGSTNGEIHLGKGVRSISRPSIAPPPPPSLVQQQQSQTPTSPVAPDLPPINSNMSAKMKSLELDKYNKSSSVSPSSPFNQVENEKDNQPLYSNIEASPTPTSNYFSSTSQKSISDQNDSLFGHQLQLQQQQRSDDNDFDDYEDSDFYDSDDLIRNFVAAVQPIYSMEEEPLYQYYTYGISLKPEDDYQPVIPKNLGLTFDLLVPRVGQRTLWCELPEVISSGILGILSDKQKQLQEAIFEILTSEVSYLKSLDVLITLFYESHELQAVLSFDEMKFICGNITEVKECSQAFLNELLKKWEESWYINEIGEVINEFALTKFQVYKEYCRNKPHQDRTLQRLRLTNDEFVSVVKSIEENPKCQLLRMDSFLMLPMQRITRLPLLVNAVIQRTQTLKEKNHCEEALKNLTNLVIDCNESARESQDAEETAAIIEKIEFPRGMRLSGPLGQFILKGDFLKNPFDQNGGSGNQLNWTFRKSRRTFYWLILFTNQLVVAKKKSSGKFEVVDLAASTDSNVKPLPNIEGLSKDFTHYFMLHFNKKETVYFLGARTQSEVQRWKTKIEGLKSTTPEKELPAEVKTLEAIFPYDARRDDEISFDVGDRLKVSTVNMKPDGWYYGQLLETTKNGEVISGWFPGNYCAEC